MKESGENFAMCPFLQQPLPSIASRIWEGVQFSFLPCPNLARPLEFPASILLVGDFLGRRVVQYVHADIRKRGRFKDELVCWGGARVVYLYVLVRYS